MTPEQQHMCEEAMKQTFRDNLPPIEADNAIRTFSAVLEATRNNNNSVLGLMKILFPF